MEVKTIRDRSLRAKKERREKMSRTRKAVEESRRREAELTQRMGKTGVEQAAHVKLQIEEQNRRRAAEVRARYYGKKYCLYALSLLVF